jgi:hypothetical protein
MLESKFVAESASELPRNNAALACSIKQNAQEDSKLPHVHLVSLKHF